MGGGGHDAHAAAEPIIPVGSSQDFALSAMALIAGAGICLWTWGLASMEIPAHVPGGHEEHGIHAPGGAVEHGGAAGEHGAKPAEHGAAPAGEHADEHAAPAAGEHGTATPADEHAPVEGSESHAPATHNEEKPAEGEQH